MHYFYQSSENNTYTLLHLRKGSIYAMLSYGDKVGKLVKYINSDLLYNNYYFEDLKDGYTYVIKKELVLATIKYYI